MGLSPTTMQAKRHAGKKNRQILLTAGTRSGIVWAQGRHHKMQTKLRLETEELLRLETYGRVVLLYADDAPPVEMASEEARALAQLLIEAADAAA